MKMVYVDFDGTLTRTSSLHYLAFARKHALLLHKSTANLLLFGLMVFALPAILALHLVSASLRDRLTYWLYRGLTQSDIERACTQYWATKEDAAKVNVIRLIRAYRTQDFSIVVVSGSLKAIVGTFAAVNNLGHLIDDYLCAELSHGEAGASGRLRVGPMVGKRKAAAITEYEKRLDEPVEQRICITDSYSDRWMLNLATRKVVVNPLGRLKRLAVRHGWDVVC